MTETKKYPTPSATFMIPTNAAGESISIEDIEYESRMAEAEAAIRWIEQEHEKQLLHDQNNYPQ